MPTRKPSTRSITKQALKPVEKMKTLASENSIKKDDSSRNPAEKSYSTSTAAPDWKHWREQGACELWKAAMLSMNIKPTDQLRGKLKSIDPVLDREFRRRLKVLDVQYGHHQSLPVRLRHPRDGKENEQKFIALQSLLEFAKDVGWSNLSHLESGLKRPAIDLPSGNTVEVDFDEFDKGKKYSLVRLGGLLKVIENWMLSDSFPKKNEYLHGGELNRSKLARDVQNAIAELVDPAKGQKVPYGFTVETNRAEFAEAIKSLKIYF